MSAPQNPAHKSSDADDDAPRSSVIKILLILVALLVVIALGLFTIISRQGTGLPLQTLTLADGSQIDLLAVQTGRQIVYDTRPLLERWLLKLPDSVRYFFIERPSVPMFAASGSRDNIFVVLRYQKRTPNKFLYVSLSDGKGWHTTAWPSGYHEFRNISNALYAFDAFPRNARVFDVVVREGSPKSAPIASFQIPNPMYKATDPTTTTVRTEITSGSYTLELVKLVAGVAEIPLTKWESGAPLEPFLPALPSGDACSIAVFRVLENGTPSDSIIPAQILAITPDGLEQYDSRHQYAYQNGLHYYKPNSKDRQSSGYYSGDGLWLLQVEFVERDPEESHRWTAVSRISTKANPNNDPNNDKVTTSIHGIDTSLTWADIGWGYTAQLRTPSTRPVYGRMQTVFDESGRSIFPAYNMGHTDRNHWSYERVQYYSLSPHTTTSTLGIAPSTTATFTMAVSPSHKVTFRAEPVYASQLK